VHGDDDDVHHRDPEHAGVVVAPAQRQGLTLVRFSAQPEPFLTQNTP